MLFEMTNELSLNELKELRGQLNEKLNDHPYTKELDEIIANKEFRLGIEAPEFSIKGMDGEDIELKNFIGKYILLDFWASWCGPVCLQRNAECGKALQGMQGQEL